MFCIFCLYCSDSTKNKIKNSHFRYSTVEFRNTTSITSGSQPQTITSGLRIRFFVDTLKSEAEAEPGVENRKLFRSWKPDIVNRKLKTESGSLRFSVFRLLTDFVCLYNYEF
jgi:hypothetical protein